MKKIVALLVIFVLMLNSSCLTIKIDKDSDPLIDFGTPIVGHFRNKDIVKGILYTVLFLTSIVGVVLFTPGDNNKSVVQLDSSISQWAMMGCAIGAGNMLAISSIDTSATYHLANKKIIDLNNIDWKYDPTGQNTKYNAIVDFKVKRDALREEEAELARLEQYRNEIETYRQKLLDRSITEDELTLINRAEKFREELKDELTYYNVSVSKDKDKEVTKNEKSTKLTFSDEKKEVKREQIDEAKIEYYKQKLIEGTIPEKELEVIEKDIKLKDLLKNELGYFYVNRSMKKKLQ